MTCAMIGALLNNEQAIGFARKKKETSFSLLIFRN